MGAWGTGLYQDDTTCDIKDDYITYLRIGMTNEEATKKIIEENDWCFEYEDEGALLWFALADTQWKYGRLLDEVKEKAIECIDSGIDLEKWKEEDEKLYKKRKKVLEELKEKLNSEQPAEKKVTKMTFHRAHWKPGDVLLYQIQNEEFKDHKWFGKYILLKVVGTKKLYSGSLPRDKYYYEEDIISLYNWIGDEKPDIKMIEKLEIIILDMNEEFLGDIKKEENKEMEKRIGVFYLTKKELKKLNIEVLTNEKKDTYSQKEIDEEWLGRRFYNIYNFDFPLIKALEKEKEKGNLIEDIK